MAKNTLIYDLNDKPKFSKLILFAIQQVLAVLAATIAVPTIIGMPIAIPSAILGAGLGTIVYLLFTKFKSPVIISSSFAFLGALANALAFGYMGIALGALFAGLVYVVIAIIVHFVGIGWLTKIMPPVIIGPTVALIGLSLAGSAMGDIVKASGSAVNGSYNLVALLCGLITFFVVVFCTVQNKRKSLRLLPFITGILAGYFVASMFSIIGYCANVEYLKIVNWDALINTFKVVNINSFFSVPKLSLVEGIRELVTGEMSAEVLAANPNATPLTWIGVAEVALAFIPVAFVTYAEHIADHSNLGSIINRHLLREEPGMTRTLLGDGVGSIVGTFFGICPNTTYGESVGCIAITKNASIRTIVAAALMLVVLAFLTPITALLRTIPSCVMGGVCLTLYGFIAVSGLKMFKNINLNKNRNLFIVSVILIAGIGGLAIQIPYALTTTESTTTVIVDGVVKSVTTTPVGTVCKTVQITSIATALLLGILTRLFCLKIEKHNNPEEEPEEYEDRSKEFEKNN